MDKVQAVENKFMDLEQQISDPAVIARQEEWQKLTKEHASLMPLVETFRKYKDITHTIEGDQEILNDPDSDDDLMAMAKEEMNGLTKEQADLEDQLHILMLPKDPRDDKNVIMELRRRCRRPTKSAALCPVDLIPAWSIGASRLGSLFSAARAAQRMARWATLLEGGAGTMPLGGRENRPPGLHGLALS